MITESNRKHGMYGTKVYWRWKAMMDRCYRKNTHAFKWYGARGIKVCKRWHNFDNYYHDTGTRPSPELSLCTSFFFL